MKRIAAVLGLAVLILSYQNCAQNKMGFDLADPAATLGLSLDIIPDRNNVPEIEHNQQYTVMVKLPEDGQVQRENITVDGRTVNYVKNALGNYEFSFTPAALAKYKILAEVWTPTGTRFEARAELQTVDTLPPVIKITPNSANDYADVIGSIQNFDLEVKDEGGGQLKDVTCLIDGSALACSVDARGKAALSVSNLRGGLHKIQVDANDNFGNSKRSFHDFSIGADLIAPIASITEDTTNTYYTIDRQRFTLSASDAHTGLQSVRCTLNGKAISTCPGIAGGSVSVNLTSTHIQEGINTLSIRALDNAYKNNVSSPNETIVTRSFEMLVDREPPTIRLMPNAANTKLVNQVQKVAFEVFDLGSGLKSGSLQCRVNGVAQACSISPSGIGEIVYTPTAPGSLVVEVSAADRYDNSRTESTTLDIVRDANVPVVTITQASTNPAVILESNNLRFNFTVQKEGNLSTITSVRCFAESVAVNCNSAADLKSGYINTSFAAAGTRTVRVEATDSTGNVGQKSFAVVVRKLSPSSILLTVNEIKTLDVLIVIDDSASMKEEQANMAQRISSFTSKLTALDWRAGIITTDIDAAEKVGQLRPIIGGNGLRWVNKTTANAQKLIGDTVQGAGILGSAKEQGIKAANLLISNKDNAPNTGFFRAGAALAILFISDENESGNTPLNQPVNLVNLVQKLWPGKPFRAHSIVQLGKDACVGSNSINTRYIEASTLTGGRIGCVVDADYGPTLGAMGQASAESVNTATLSCEPYNRQVSVLNSSGSEVNVNYTISGRTITFSSNLPVGQFTLSYNCVQ